MAINFSDHIQSVKGENDLKVVNIGDGNLNDVLKVSTVNGAEEKHDVVIVKYSPPYVKCLGPEFPLSQERILIEYRSLQKWDTLSPGSVPKPFCYDQQYHATVMEYLHGFEVMKKQLIQGTVDKVAIQRLAENIGRIHSATHVTNLSAPEFDGLKSDFKNESLCDFSREYIFTFPYIKGQETNKVKPELHKAADMVYNDQSLLTDVDKFKRLFLESEECLVHGDLHTGSVMVKDGVPKIIDNEFSCVGPAAFDLGLLVAHYIISYYQHMLTEDNNTLHRLIAHKMMDACKTTGSSYFEYFQPSVPDRALFIKNFMSDVAGFAGCELIRRVLGVAHVEDINHSGSMELEVLECGRRLLGAHTRIQSMDRLLFIGLQLC